MLFSLQVLKHNYGKGPRVVLLAYAWIVQRAGMGPRFNVVHVFLQRLLLQHTHEQ